MRFEAARASGPMPRPGTTITAVEAQGKYLLVRFADGHVLQTHMKMTGRWDLYRTGARWWKPAHLARAVIEVEGWTAVCFSAPVVRIIRVQPDDRRSNRSTGRPARDRGRRRDGDRPTEAKPASAWQWIDATARAAAPSTRRAGRTGTADGSSRRTRSGPSGPSGCRRRSGVAADGPARADRVPRPGDGLGSHRDQRFASLDHLGPDLCVAGVDLDVAVAADDHHRLARRRHRRRPARPAGRRRRRQRVQERGAVGVPAPPAHAAGSGRRGAAPDAARDRREPSSRPTSPPAVAPPSPARPGSLAVYHRSRRPCRRCGTPIRWTRTGRDNRSTYWCPRCQPARPPGRPLVGRQTAAAVRLAPLRRESPVVARTSGRPARSPHVERRRPRHPPGACGAGVTDGSRESVVGCGSSRVGRRGAVGAGEAAGAGAPPTSRSSRPAAVVGAPPLDAGHDPHGHLGATARSRADPRARCGGAGATRASRSRVATSGERPGRPTGRSRCTSTTSRPIGSRRRRGAPARTGPWPTRPSCSVRTTTSMPSPTSSSTPTAGRSRSSVGSTTSTPGCGSLGPVP